MLIDDIYSERAMMLLKFEIVEEKRVKAIIASIIAVNHRNITHKTTAR